MPDPIKFQSITPLVCAGPSLAEALKFYTTHLGFAVTWQGGGMAGVRRGEVALNLVESDDRHWAENCSMSIGVTDLDALYAEYSGIPARVGPLEIKHWGRREFHIVDPVGVCFQFYQSVP